MAKDNTVDGTSWPLNDEEAAIFSMIGTGNGLNVERYLPSPLIPFNRDGKIPIVIEGLIRNVFAMGNRVVLLGDSSTRNGYTTVKINGVDVARALTNRAIVDTANDMIGQKLNIVGRVAEGGDGLEEMFGKYETHVAPLKPTLLIVMGGANEIDRVPTRPASYAFFWLMKIWARAIRDNCFVLYLGSTGRARGNTNTQPWTDGVVYKQGTEFPALYNRARIADQCVPGFRFFDLSQGTRDWGANITAGDAAMGKAITGAFATFTNDQPDPSHVGPLGTVLSAIPLAKFLNTFVGSAAPDRTYVNSYGAYGDPGSMGAGNPFMMGRTSAYIQAPCEGFGPSDIIVRAGNNNGIKAICDTVARIDGGPGRALKMDISGSVALTDHIEVAGAFNYTGEANLEAFMQSGVNVTSVTSGHVHNIIGELDFLGANTGSGAPVLLTIGFGASYTGPSIAANEGYSGVIQGKAYGLTGPIDFGLKRSPRLPTPVGTVRVSYRLRIQPTVTAQVQVHVTEFGPRVNLEAPDVMGYIK